jgi:hypothetical protein
MLRMIGAAFAALAVLSCASAGPATAQVPGPPPSWPPEEEEPTPTPTPAPGEAEGEEEDIAPIVLPSLEEKLRELEEAARTAGGALRYFMAHRSYRTIRDLKRVMTPALVARFDSNSAPFNGKRGIRIAAFDFTERDLKPVASQTRTAGAAGAPAAGAADSPGTYAASVRSLWEDQGELTEQRVESIRIVRQPDGAWRVGSLQIVSSDKPKPIEPIPGVTVLRIVLRAWHRRDLSAARPHFSEAFAKRHQARPEALERIFVGGESPRHAAFQVQDLRQPNDSLLTARVRLFETSPGQPGILETQARTLRLVRNGPYWHLDGWD